jgi:hypothetical protein
MSHLNNKFVFPCFQTSCTVLRNMILTITLCSIKNFCHHYTSHIKKPHGFKVQNINWLFPSYPTASIISSINFLAIQNLSLSYYSNTLHRRTSLSKLSIPNALFSPLWVLREDQNCTFPLLSVMTWPNL